MTTDAHRLAWWLVAITVAAAWLLPFPWFETLNNPNENVRVYMTRAIVEHHTFAIEQIEAEWGYVNDKATRDGHLYAGKAPGASYLAVPAWFIAHRVNLALERTPSRAEVVWICRLGASILPLLAFLVAFARGSRRWVSDVATRQLMVLALGVGSTLFTYGLIFASHAAAAAGVFAGVILFEKHREQPDRLWIPALSGFLMAAAITMEYPAALGVLVVAIWSSVRAPRRGVWILGNILGGLLPIALLVIFHWKAFGGPLETPYAHLENPEFRESHSAGFFGMERVQRASLIGSFIAPSNGLFYFVPWTFVAVLGLIPAIRARQLREPAAVTLAAFIVYTVFISMVDNWRGGWTAGPRYIVPLIPFAGWYAMHVAQWARERAGWPWFLAVLSGSVGVGIVCCAVSGVVFPHYPTEVFNPVYEIGVFLPAHGWWPHTVLERFGAPIGAGLVPLAIMVAATWAYTTWRAASPTLATSAAVVTMALCLTVLGVRQQAGFHTEQRQALYQARTTLTNIWEPRRSDTAGALHRGTMPADLIVPVSEDALREAAHEAAVEGFDMTALDLLRAATDWSRAGGPARAPSRPIAAEPSDEGTGD